MAIGLQPSMPLRGRVVFDATTLGAPANLLGIDVALAPVQTLTNLSAVLRVPAKTDAAGVFALVGVTPGRYSFQASVPTGIGAPGTWMLKSAVVRGRDVLDFPVEIGPNDTISDVVLTLTDATQELAGTLEDASGRHPAGFGVVIFPADPRYWITPSRRIRTTQPATDGSFVVKNLPVGNYRIAAVRDLSPDDATDAAFLEQLMTSSIPFTLAAGERKTQKLTIREPRKPHS